MKKPTAIQALLAKRRGRTALPRKQDLSLQQQEEIRVLLSRINTTEDMETLRHLFEESRDMERVRAMCFAKMSCLARTPSEFVQLYFCTRKGQEEALLTRLQGLQASVDEWYEASLTLEPYPYPRTQGVDGRTPIAEIIYTKIPPEEWKRRYQRASTDEEKVQVGQFAGFLPKHPVSHFPT